MNFFEKRSAKKLDATNNISNIEFLGPFTKRARLKGHSPQHHLYYEQLLGDKHPADRIHPHHMSHPGSQDYEIPREILGQIYHE
jgi:hypothetical protein